MAKGTTTDVAVKETAGELEIYDFGDYAGAGLEGIRMEEQLTPILRMIQGLSPQLNRSKAEYIPEAKQGMILNTATQELYDGDDGLDMIVCARSYHYGAWAPRDSGGGFRGIHSPDEPLVQSLLAKHGRFKTLPFMNPENPKEELQLVETGQLYVLFATPGDLSADTASRAIVAFSKTAMPVYQSHITRHMNWKWPQRDGTVRPAALWSYRWRLQTRSDSNAKGDYFNWSLKLAPPATNAREALIPVDDPLFKLGVEFNELFNKGQIKPDYDADTDPDAAPF